jgi:hypothetical protein
VARQGTLIPAGDDETARASGLLQREAERLHDVPRVGREPERAVLDVRRGNILLEIVEYEQQPVGLEETL